MVVDRFSENMTVREFLEIRHEEIEEDLKQFNPGTIDDIEEIVYIEGWQKDNDPRSDAEKSADASWDDLRMTQDPGERKLRQGLAALNPELR